ncbi:vitamin K epoxide reductase family protein [uncultured Lacinutrix sp.]|uniref:vitamin K epoxide reductase family protein n=1 Tax=uncultured Lacinutrix sp. TaxID=574032 RepID=UPI0026271283|nr:vitamin K epoxide reductase family protein [uncultured Lacinutrix sp.]
MENTLVSILEKLLKKNQIPFDKKELSFQIQSHPSYPSLHAITGVLDHFNIENIAADVPVNVDTLLQLPNYFIAQINTNKGQSLTLVEKKNLEYYIFNTESKKQVITTKEFLNKFTGIIVAVEKKLTNEEKSSNRNIFKHLGFIFISILSLFLIFNNLASIGTATIFHLGLSIIGLITSIAIVKQELGLQTSIGDAFCSGADEKKDCDAVLTSNGSKIIKDYKLSDFSILYFASLTLLTCFQISNPVISFSINLLTIPVTLYSIYYQYAIVKKWCPLCLVIVGVLWLQVTTLIIANTFISDFVINDFLVFGLTTISVYLVWSYIKPMLTSINKLKKEQIENVKFKRNFALFENLLQKSSQVSTTINDAEEIVFGNRSSNLEIVLITNPFCGHCKPVHKQINNILHKYHDKVNIKIRFNVNVKNENTDLLKVTSRLLEIYKEKGEQHCLQAMNDIYKNGNTITWLKKWGENKIIFMSELKKEGIWCKNNTINFTPEILINGQAFPKEYNRTDLIFFIEELEEKYNQTLIPVKKTQTT